MVYKILIIDDEATIRRLMSVLLKRHGHEIIEAADGESGIKAAIAQQPDIILLDIMMPHMDGYETLRRLRATPNAADIPVIYVSAKSQVEDRVEGLRLGADDYVVKPADPAELLMRIEAVMNRSRRRTRRRRAATHAFLGVRGGAGTSTILVNLGAHLQQTGMQTLLVDLHLAFGTLIYQLNLLPLTYSTANLATIAPETIDDTVVQRCLLAHPSGLKLLAGSPTVPIGITFAPEHLTAITEQAGHCAQVVLIDLPTDPDIIECVANLLDSLTLVLSNDPASLHAAENIAAYLRYLNLDAQINTILVDHHAMAQPFLTPALIEERTGYPCLANVPAKPEPYLQAEQLRTPLMMNGYDAADRSIYAQIGERLIKRSA
ncbi:MAG: response regulator [Caldilineaceae bacterium]|nr:response regulator [Caldilineaceae bacterium]